MKQFDAINIIKEALHHDNSVKAVFLKGSMARGNYDEYSDIDLYCMVNEDDLDDFLPKRIEYMERYRPLIFWQEVDFVGPQIVGVFDNGLHFDLYTVTPESLRMTDEIKVLHDPNNLLSDYKSENLGISSNELVEYFDEISFTVLEFEAAYKRNDLLWASRLSSHISGYLSVILRSIYDTDNARLGFKRLHTRLDDKMNARLVEAMNLLGPSSVLRGVLSLLEIVNETIAILPEATSNKINQKLFHYMFEKAKALERNK